MFHAILVHALFASVDLECLASDCSAKLFCIAEACFGYTNVSIRSYLCPFGPGVESAGLQLIPVMIGAPRYIRMVVLHRQWPKPPEEYKLFHRYTANGFSVMMHPSEDQRRGSLRVNSVHSLSQHSNVGDASRHSTPTINGMHIVSSDSDGMNTNEGA